MNVEETPLSKSYFTQKRVCIIGRLTQEIQKLVLPDLLDAKEIVFVGSLTLYEEAKKVLMGQSSYSFPKLSHISVSEKKNDSPGFALMNNLNAKADLKFDFIYIKAKLDLGADALLFSLVDKILEPGGLVAMSDYGWSMAKSPTRNPQKNKTTAQDYTIEQIKFNIVREFASFYLKDCFELETANNEVKIFQRAN